MSQQSGSREFRKGHFLTVPNKTRLCDLTPIELCLFIALCGYADDEGFCYPSISTLSKSSGLSATSVKKAKLGLEKKKWLKVLPGNSFKSNRYVMYELEPRA